LTLDRPKQVLQKCLQLMTGSFFIIVFQDQ
jgi:hypothetical protein